MQTIYKPKGRAEEYSNLALNLYKGCSHGCTYCYVPKMPQFWGKEEEFKNPIARPGIMSALAKHVKSYEGKQIFLCFTCDPYQHLEVVEHITDKTLKLFSQYDVTPRILTKGGTRCVRDFDLMKSTNAVLGATLTFLDDADSKLWEPNAALPDDRIYALLQAHNEGIYTWASLEPVIDPMQTLEIILATRAYVDEYKIGKLNYHPLAKTIDWSWFTKKAVALLEKHNKKYYIKADLKEYL